MKQITVIILLGVLFVSADNGAQTKCITCPDSVSIAPSIYKADSVLLKMENLSKLQDSLLYQLKRQYDKSNTPTIGRSEVYQLFNGRYRYDWYYNKNGFTHVKIKKL